MVVKKQKSNLHFSRDSLSSTFLKELPMIACVVLSLLLVIMDASGSRTLEKVKMGMQSAFSPIFYSASKVTNTLDDFFLNFNTVSELNKKNQQLLSENYQMQMWRNRALRFEAENASLKDLLKFEKINDYDIVSAPIAIDNSKSFNRNIVVKSKRVHKNQTILSAKGLVGRVLEAGDKYANVLLITDVASRVPVLVERTRDKAIAAGKNSDRLRLNYLPENADIHVGDRIITSGDGLVFLPGLLVGTISYIEGSKVLVKPATNFNRLEFVSILKEKNK